MTMIMIQKLSTMIDVIQLLLIVSQKQKKKNDIVRVHLNQTPKTSLPVFVLSNTGGSFWGHGEIVFFVWGLPLSVILIR